jgi:hypothetical protein
MAREQDIRWVSWKRASLEAGASVSDMRVMSGMIRDEQVAD